MSFLLMTAAALCLLFGAPTAGLVLFIIACVAALVGF